MWADASMKLVIEMGTGLARYRCLLNFPASRSRGCASAGCLNCSRCLVPTWIDKTVAIDRAELLDIGKKELLTSIDNDFWIRLIRNILPQCFDSQRVWQEHWQETEGRRYPRWFWTLSEYQLLCFMSKWQQWAVLAPATIGPAGHPSSSMRHVVSLYTKSPQSSLSISHSVEQIDLVGA